MARMASGYQISDELWERIERLLPVHVNTHPFGGGKPRTPDRVCMNAIFFVLKTGCQWGALDATGICPHSTAHDRFQEWVQAGVFWQLWSAGLMEYDELQGIDWSWVSGDGAMTKAPLAGEKNRAESHGSGQTRHQAKSVDGGRRNTDRSDGGRRERQRLQVVA
jgi:transposase